jgi:ADP-ribosyl-[dinitrogen reductase] hydrolase
MTLASRIEGGLVGLLVGDALGVPYEFHVPENLPAATQLEMQPPQGFNRSHRGVPPGTWSDDGAQALALLDSVLTCGGLDPTDLGQRFVDWWNKGAYAVDARPFDIGNQTTDALERLESGLPALECGGRDERDNGNGSLMRVLPLALWHAGTDAELVQDAHHQSRVTHGHARSEAACALYCLWTRAILAEQPHPYDTAVRTLRALYTEHEVHQQQLGVLLAPFEPKGTGYVVDCLHSSQVALREPTYEQVVRRAIRFGFDTDTTAAVAGGIAGLIHGIDGIPARWREALRGRDILDPLLDRLFQSRGIVRAS